MANQIDWEVLSDEQLESRISKLNWGPAALEFNDVDSHDPASHEAYLKLVSSLEEVRLYKRYAYEMLEIKADDSVLDIGCGTGDEAIELAKWVGKGRVIGVDRSHAMLAQASARAGSTGLPVSFQQGDINALPFANADFDCVRIDRVLHFLPDPELAMREAVRVTVAGSRVVVSEPDWNTLKIDSGDHRDLAIRDFVAGQPNGGIALALLQLFAAMGVTVTGSRRSTLQVRDFALANAVFGLEAMAGGAIRFGVLSVAEAVQWLRSVQTASANLTLNVALSGGTVAGVKA